MTSSRAFPAHIVKVYDGDTVTADVDLGFGVVLKNQTIRIVGINAPEVCGEQRPQGLITRDYLRELIMDKNVFLVTQDTKSKQNTKDKYGRWLCEVKMLDDDGVSKNDVAQVLCDKGLAVWKTY